MNREVSADIKHNVKGESILSSDLVQLIDTLKKVDPKKIVFTEGN